MKISKKSKERKKKRKHWVPITPMLGAFTYNLLVDFEICIKAEKS